MNPIDDISDKELSDLYHEASHERTPASLDRAVLELAREHVQIHNTNTRLRKLTPRFAWAAVVVLSIGVVLSIQFDNSRDLIEPSRDESSLAFKPRPPARLEKAKPEPKAKQSIEPISGKSLAVQVVPQRKNITAEGETEFSRPQPAEAPKEPESLADRRSTIPPPILESDSSDKATAASNDSDVAKAPLASVKPAPPPHTSSASGKPAAARPAPRLMIAPAASDAAPLARKTPPSIENSSAKSPPPAKISNKALNSTQTSRSRMTAEKVVNCADLSPYACAVSANCILAKSDTGLICRDAENHCEFAFNQIESSQSICEGFGGCRFIDGDCKCNKESEQCVCNSKGPAICSPSK